MKSGLVYMAVFFYLILVACQTSVLKKDNEIILEREELYQKSLQENWVEFQGKEYNQMETDLIGFGESLYAAFILPEKNAYFPVFDMMEDKPADRAYLFWNEILYQSEAPLLFEDGILSFSGMLAPLERFPDKGVEPVLLRFRFVPKSITLGSSSLVVQGDKAYLNGNLGFRTYKQIQNLIAQNPEVQTIVFQEVPGSVDDDINVLTGKMVHNAGLFTELEEDSVIASGGTDLYLAGVRRYMRKGAKIGVHSWCCTETAEGPKPADQLDRGDKNHRWNIQYYKDIQFPNAKNFYFFTLSAAPFEDTHYMTLEEIEKYRVVTDYLDSVPE